MGIYLKIFRGARQKSILGGQTLKNLSAVLKKFIVEFRHRGRVRRNERLTPHTLELKLALIAGNRLESRSASPFPTNPIVLSPQISAALGHNSLLLYPKNNPPDLRRIRPQGSHLPKNHPRSPPPSVTRVSSTSKPT